MVIAWPPVKAEGEGREIWILFLGTGGTRIQGSPAATSLALTDHLLRQWLYLEGGVGLKLPVS